MDPSSPPRKSAAGIGYQSSLSSFVAQGNNPQSPTKRPKLLSKKGKTLHLYDPADVAAHTPCSIIHNFLPPDDANSLLEELLGEASTFEKMTFKLFDNVVQSPHTTCFYVKSFEEMQVQKTEYLYNGSLLEVCKTISVSLSASAPDIDYPFSSASKCLDSKLSSNLSLTDTIRISGN